MESREDADSKGIIRLVENSSIEMTGEVFSESPKGTEFDTIGTREIKRVHRQLDDRPKVALGFYKPDEKCNELVALDC